MEHNNDLFESTLRDSNKNLLVIEMLANFYNQPVLFNILLRTKIIHNLFEKNKALDVLKLELFHIQYSSTLIELLRKLKKAKEKQYLLVSDEIHINESFIEKLEQEQNETVFYTEAKQYANNLSAHLLRLYKMLAEETLETFSWDEILNFSNRFKFDFYRPISQPQYQMLCQSQSAVYQNMYVRFERKLLGRLNINRFKIKFRCGLVFENNLVEIFEFRDTNDLFAFIMPQKTFYFVSETHLNSIDLSKNKSTKNDLILQLKYKNSELKASLPRIKSNLTEQVSTVLNDYLSKISEVNFLDNLQEVDEQTNILRAMLNIKY